MIKRKIVRKEKQRKRRKGRHNTIDEDVKKKNERKFKKIARTGKINAVSRKEYCINCR